MSKIFGEIQTTEDLNELANNLRKTKEFDEIRLLCSENGISEETAEAFIKGEQLLLAASGHQEKAMALQSPTWNAVRAAIKKQDISAEDIAAAAERIRQGMILPLISESAEELLDKAVKATEKEPKSPPVVHTVEDVKKKLEAELEIYRDGDSKYVVDKLVELCQKDKVLLEAIMLPHKSYDKAFQYFYQQSRTVGYQMPHGNLVYLDNDAAVKLSVENTQRPASKQGKAKQEDSKNKAQPFKPQAEIKPATVTAKQAEPKKEPAPRREPEPKAQKPKTREIDGQLSLFDF